jgi:hypothetical protein
MPISFEGLVMYKMYNRSILFTALALGMACRCAPLLANDAPASDATDQQTASGIHEVDDSELSTMRGRYVVGDNTVVWFGVEMISSWQTNTGQTLQSAMTIGMNFSKNPSQPQVTFVPTVTITTADAPLPTSTAQSNLSRSVQTGGIANVGGLAQSVQIAGDHNAASNVTSLNIQNGGNVPTTTSSSTSSVTSNTSPSTSNNTPAPANPSVAVTSPTVNVSSSVTDLASNSGSGTSSNTSPATSTNTGSNTPTGRTASTGDATASSTYSNNSAEVNLAVTGQGSVSQWIHTGSIGQTIALTTDNAVVTNQMIVNLVTQSINATSQLVAHNLAQSFNLSHSTGH